MRPETLLTLATLPLLTGSGELTGDRTSSSTVASPPSSGLLNMYAGGAFLDLQLQQGQVHRCHDFGRWTGMKPEEIPVWDQMPEV